MKKQLLPAPRHRILSRIGVLLALAPLVAFQAAAVGGEQAAATPRVVVAKVNGRPIYEEQLEPRTQAQLRKYSRLGVQESSDQQLRQLRLAALEEVIATELFLQASEKLDLPDIEKRLETELAAEKAKPSFDPNRVSEQEMREHLRKRLYLTEYLERNNLREPQVPEEEIKTFYEQNKEGFASTSDAAHVRHILIKVEEGADAAAKDAARKQIQDLRQQLAAGKDFEQLAKESSQDANATNGGDLGFIEPGYMPPAFDAVAFALEPGKLSDIVETPFGFHVLEVLARAPKGTVASYENMREFLRKYLQEETRQRNMKAHTQMLREQARIEILLPEVQGGDTPSAGVTPAPAK